jgi:flagellar motor switch protein FliN/FliY
MNTTSSVVDEWLDVWTQEFGRAIEMFSGQQPGITYSRSKELAPIEMGDLLWWKQSFHTEQPFETWIGAKESTWMAIGAVAGDPEATAAQAAYLEIIGQAQHGVASVVGLQTGLSLRAGEGQLGAAPDFHSLEYALVGVQLNGTELPSLALAIDPRIRAILDPPESPALEPARSAAALPAPAALEGASMSPMLSRLMDLELPLSVALGRAKMPIGDVLRVTTGSLIELDRNVSDHVELIVHGTVVARGEVVSVRGNYGVRIKEIISRQDRISLYAPK